MYASKKFKDEAAKILACASISTTPIVNPIAVFFIIEINEFPKDEMLLQKPVAELPLCKHLLGLAQ